MELKEISGLKNWIRAYRLYISAFPRYERKPFMLIRRMFLKGSADVWVIEDEGVFSGIAVTMNSDDMILLDYFAVDKKKRGCGIGSAALKSIREKYSGKRLFLEIESVFSDCSNKTERIRRKSFYLRNGMSELKISVKLFGTDMELLGFGCELTFDDYVNIYTKNLGKWAAENIKETKYPSSDGGRY